MRASVFFRVKISPNHHALAEQFVQLDNYYCNGVNSADGHAWSTEGNVTDHLEKSFGGFTRSYTFGDDPLSYSSTGFLWDNVLSHGLSFRNYGEMDYASPVPEDKSFTDVYTDFINKTPGITFTQKIGIAKLQQYTAQDYPGWNMRIPDVLRADAFLTELKAYEKRGYWPNLSIVYLPNDHTSGTSENMPTPAAHMADNDLALGRIVDGLSHSPFWKKMAIFIIEDDPQNGFDHVDGHRSICFVVSPWAKRGALVSDFYNQTSVLHTMQRILALPPMNQMDAMAPVMHSCFQEEPDFTPYTHLPNIQPLDELNPVITALNTDEQHWATLSAAQDFDHVDAADETSLNMILWHAMKGVDAPYPTAQSGAHGTGLKALGLDFSGEEDEDD